VTRHDWASVFGKHCYCYVVPSTF